MKAKKEMDWSILRDKTVETLEHLMDRYQFAADEDKEDSDWIAQARRNYINDAIINDQELWIPYLVDFDNAAKAAMHELFERGKRVYEKMSAKYKGWTVDVEATLLPSKRYPTLHPIQDRFHEMLWEHALRSKAMNKYFKWFASSIDWSSDDTHHLEKLEDDVIYDPNDNWNEGLDRELTKNLHLSHYFHRIWECSSFAYTDFIFVREFDTRIEVSITKDDTLK